MSSDREVWSLEKWLKKMGMHRKYKQAFIDNGYETAELCANLNKDDLDAIGVTNKGHRSTLFIQSKKLQELVSKEAFTVSEEVLEESPVGKAKFRMAPIPSPQHLPDYSEPWNSNAAPGSVSPRNTLNAATATAPGGEATDGPSPSGRKPPLSPGVELPTSYKREGSGYTKLQLKLKIREELFTRGVVLSEPPYCMEVSEGGGGVEGARGGEREWRGRGEGRGSGGGEGRGEGVEGARGGERGREVCEALWMGRYVL